MKISRLIITLALCFGALIPLSAQTGSVSPYSRYGYGLLRDNATAAQRSMGYVGYAMNSGRQINVMNPASYAAIDSLTFLFDMGVDFSIINSSEGSLKENNYGGGLDYITMQIPLTKWMGASFGILPFSSVGYSFGNSIDNGSVSRQGQGGLSQLYLGLGFNPFRNFYIGANIAYLWGSTSNALYTTTITGSTSIFERSMSVRDWRADFGVQYRLNLNPENRVTLGVVYSPKKDLHGDTYGIYYDISASSVVPDTVNAGDHRLKGRYSLPETWGAGINWEFRRNLMVEADFTYQPWSKAKFGSIEHFEDTRYSDRWKVGAGMQFIPSQRGSYFKRMMYRLGGYYNRDYIMIGNNKVNDYGITAGFGFPVPGFKSIVSLGFEYHHRQANPNPLIKENYFNITLGINFNEMWFQKNRLY